MYSTSDFRKGLKIMYEGAPWEVIDYQHVKMQMRKALVRTRMRNLLTMRVLEVNFPSAEKFEQPDLEYRKMQYLYKDDTGFVFMDMQSYDQLSFSEEQVGDARPYLKENLDCDVVVFQGRPITVQVPNHIVFRVVRTEPGFKGDTAGGGATKPATLESGATLHVPLFIKEGEKVKVDTRTGEYIERISE